MALERTLSIIKPDAVAKNVIGQIYARFEGGGLKVIAARMAQLSRAEAEAFYAVHRARPFFGDLVSFMISGPVMIQVLEGEGGDREEPRADGRDRSEEGRPRHDPRRLRGEHRRQRRPWFRRRRDRRGRDRVLLRRHEPPHSLNRRALGMVNLLQFDRGALADWCEQQGEQAFRATQLFRWIHQRGERDFAAMSNLAKSFRDKLVASAEVVGLAVASEQVAEDGTIKWLFDVGAGDAVETVFIPETGRGTLCISSQAGCAVNCRFCATGHQGFSRNLTHRRDRRPALARRVRAAPAPRPARRRTRDHQRRDDGNGRAAAELRRSSCRRCERCSTTTATACRAVASRSRPRASCR